MEILAVLDLVEILAVLDLVEILAEIPDLVSRSQPPGGVGDPGGDPGDLARGFR